MDRLLVELWVFAPIIYGLDDGILARQAIPKFSALKDVNYFRDLSAEQAELIGQRAAFNQSANRWEVRATVHVMCWFYSPRVGWVSTGRRKVFHHDALPVLGVPAKRVIPPVTQEQPKRANRAVITESLHNISSALTKVAAGSYGPSELPELTAQIADEISKLRVVCYPLYSYLDKIAAYLTTLDPRDAGWVSEKLITPLVLAAQQFLSD
jgi:hypothetical protein